MKHSAKKLGLWFLYILLSLTFLFLCVELGKSLLTEERRQAETWRGKFLPRIEVDRPLQNEKVKSPLIISGTAGGSWFSKEDFFEVQIKDPDGVILAEGKVYKIEEKGLGENPEMFPFRGSVGYRTPKTNAGSVDLVRFHGKDYDDTYPPVFSIPILFDK